MPDETVSEFAQRYFLAGYMLKTAGKSFGDSVRNIWEKTPFSRKVWDNVIMAPEVMKREIREKIEETPQQAVGFGQTLYDRLKRKYGNDLPRKLAEQSKYAGTAIAGQRIPAYRDLPNLFERLGKSVYTMPASESALYKGYYMPETDKIYLGDPAASVVDHELTHKVLGEAGSNMKLAPVIRFSGGPADNYFINYGTTPQEIAARAGSGVPEKKQVIDQKIRKIIQKTPALGNSPGVRNYEKLWQEFSKRLM